MAKAVLMQPWSSVELRWSSSVPALRTLRSVIRKDELYGIDVPAYRFKKLSKRSVLCYVRSMDPCIMQWAVTVEWGDAVMKVSARPSIGVFVSNGVLIVASGLMSLMLIALAVVAPFLDVTVHSDNMVIALIVFVPLFLSVGLMRVMKLRKLMRGSQQYADAVVDRVAELVSRVRFKFGGAYK